MFYFFYVTTEYINCEDCEIVLVTTKVNELFERLVQIAHIIKPIDSKSRDPRIMGMFS